MAHDYGICHAFGGNMREKLTDQTLQQGGEWLLIRAVPTGVCERCGEEVFRWDVTQRLEEISCKHGKQAPVSTIQVPVFAF